ncbi:MAG: PKD domain-containing protein, partial [Caldimonas sp.]
MFGCQRLSRRLFGACLGVTFLLAGCGGGDDAAAPVTPPVVVTPKATAAFTAPASAAANQPVVFDASTSTSSDGSALSYYWDFGDGLHGSGKTIARSFASGGARSVTLTVVDGASLRDTQTKTLTVAAPVAGASVMAAGRITGLDGVAIEGVAVVQAALGNAAASASTDALGKVSISLASNVPLALKLSKTGFADQFVSLTIPAGTGADAYFEAVLRPRDAALSLADAATGGTLSGRDGVSIALPANALVNGAGTAASGAVQIAMTPVDVTAPGAGGFPGSFDGIKADGTTTPIVSFGTVEFVLSSGVDRLQLAAGKTATIEVPIYGAMRPDGTVLAVGDTTPLWSLDETTSTWIQEGTGTVVASADSPSGLAMRATVSHLSWWNSDLGFDPYGPKPKCVFDTDSGNPGGLDTFATATVCNMLADIDRGPSASQSLRSRPLSAAQAAPLPPRVAGYHREALLPIAGGTRIPVPANVGIVLSATMLNGSWTGRTVINGPVGVEEEVQVKMRQIATTGSAPEAITVPFDAVRSLITGQTALYTFNGVAAQYARITVGDGTGSNLSGQVRLLQGTTALGSASFGPGTGIVVAALPVDGSYTIELTGTANTPGVYHLQVELLGG